jgi:hypothetical protein
MYLNFKNTLLKDVDYYPFFNALNNALMSLLNMWII